MSISFKNRERLQRLFYAINSPHLLITSIVVALALMCAGLVKGWWITAGLAGASAVIDILRMRWLQKRGLWGGRR